MSTNSTAMSNKRKREDATSSKRATAPEIQNWIRVLGQKLKYQMTTLEELEMMDKLVFIETLTDSENELLCNMRFWETESWTAWLSMLQEKDKLDWLENPLGWEVSLCLSLEKNC